MPILFLCHMRSFPHTPARPFHYSFSTSVFVFLLFSLPCREQASPKQFGSFLPPLKREVGCRKASRRDFLKKIDFKKKVLRCLIPQSSSMTAPFSREPNLIPQSTHFVRSQLPFQGSLFCRSATFPHTVGNHHCK